MTFTNNSRVSYYYAFPSVDVDRYTVNGIYQQVFVSPREINLKALPEGAQTWVNTWLQYTHGYGAVMTPAAQVGEESMRWFMQGIPPESASGLTLKEAGIYYGLESYNPVIAPNESHKAGTTYMPWLWQDVTETIMVRSLFTPSPRGPWSRVPPRSMR